MSRAAFSRSEGTQRAAIRAIGVLCLLCCIQTASATEAYVLGGAAPQEAVSAAKATAIHSGLLAPTIFIRQSFSLARHGEALGSLIVGRASHPNGGAAVGYTCFVVYVPHSDGPQQLVQTVGSGEWEAESCEDVRSVGLIDGAAGPDVTIGMVFDARSPNADVAEPVVLRLNSGNTLDIDLKASRKASGLGATDLKAMRKLDFGKTR